MVAYDSPEAYEILREWSRSEPEVAAVIEELGGAEGADRQKRTTGRVGVPRPNIQGGTGYGQRNTLNSQNQLSRRYAGGEPLWSVRSGRGRLLSLSRPRPSRAETADRLESR